VRQPLIFKAAVVTVVLVLALLPVTQAFAQGLPQSKVGLDSWAGSRCNEATARAGLSFLGFLATWYAGNPYMFVYKFYQMVDDIGQEWYICRHFGN
jgi:hypothetical protein